MTAKISSKKICNFTRTETSKIPLQCSASNMDHEIVAARMERAYKRYIGCRLYPTEGWKQLPKDLEAVMRCQIVTKPNVYLI